METLRYLTKTRLYTKMRRLYLFSIFTIKTQIAIRLSINFNPIFLVDIVANVAENILRVPR